MTFKEFDADQRYRPLLFCPLIICTTYFVYIKWMSGKNVEKSKLCPAGFWLMDHSHFPPHARVHGTSNNGGSITICDCSTRSSNNRKQRFSIGILYLTLIKKHTRCAFCERCFISVKPTSQLSLTRAGKYSGPGTGIRFVGGRIFCSYVFPQISNISAIEHEDNLTIVKGSSMHGVTEIRLFLFFC